MIIRAFHRRENLLLPRGVDRSEAGVKSRFLFIDALRGIAALLVAYFHMLHSTQMDVTLHRIFPAWVRWPGEFGGAGVSIFFVLSGFVIAHSLRHASFDPKAIGRFIVARQLRLDPPYWCALILALAIHAARLRFPRLITAPLPSVGAIALNFVYLQNFLQAEQILLVAWTLCIEIQFYLCFILILAAATHLLADQRARFEAAATLTTVTGCASLITLFLKPNSVWFSHFWYLFALGALCYWTLQGLVNPKRFYFLVGCFAVAIFLFAFKARPTDAEEAARQTLRFAGLLVGFGTVLLIYVVGLAGRLATLWTNPVIQYFGRISYSLYLVHWPVAITVLQAGYKLTGTNEKVALVWFAAAGLLSVAAAHLLFVTVERPAMLLASSFRRRLDSAQQQQEARQLALP